MGSWKAVGTRLTESFLQDPLSGEQTALVENSRPRGVQFPFAVSDQVLIKVSN